ncbi:MFS transporter [Candidatus Saccharibacteria bacterium]|nr:MFS transporter [Candidatus Saccharibacteria bacterium]
MRPRLFLQHLKSEPNVIIAIMAFHQIINLFRGPFLAAYFIKTSADSLPDLSLYYIFSFAAIAVIHYFISRIGKTRHRIAIFRFGVIMNFFYFLALVFIKSAMIRYLAFFALIHGFASSSYWMPLNLFIANKVDNSHRTKFTVRQKILTSTISVVVPLLLGSIITATDYRRTAIIILIISFIQIILSFFITPEPTHHLSRFNLKQTLRQLLKKSQVRRMALVEFASGLCEGHSALDALVSVLIFQSFRTDVNLGLFTSLSTVISMFALHIYGKYYKKRSDHKLVLITSFIPIFALLLLFVIRNNFTLVFFQICYITFASLILLARDIRLYNLADSKLVSRDNQCEFLVLREISLDAGRVFGYLILFVAASFGGRTILNLSMILFSCSMPFIASQLRKIHKFDRTISPNESK